MKTLNPNLYLDRIKPKLPTTSVSYCIFLFALVILVYNLVCQSLIENTYLTILDHFCFYSLGIILLELPTYCTKLATKYKADYWVCNESIFLLILLSFLVVIGCLVTEEFSYYIKWPISLLGILLSIGIVINEKKIRVLDTIGVLLLSVYFILLYYNNGYHHPFFTERLYQGLAHIDELYLVSLAQILLSTGEVSTGLNTLIPFSYHYGSNFTFGAMSKLLNVDIVDFYNVGYLGILAPVFLKQFVAIIRKLGALFFSVELPVNFVIIFFAIVFTFNKSVSVPFSSESILLSLVLVHIIFIFILDHGIDLFKQLGFLLLSLVVITLISFTKISTGLPVGLYFLYQYFRSNKSLRPQHIPLYVAGMIAVVLIYIEVIPKSFFQDPENGLDYLLKCLSNLFRISRSFLSNFFSLILLFFLFKYFNKKNRIEAKDLFFSDKYWFVSLLLISGISGILLGLYTSGHAGTVYNSFYSQYYFAILLSIPFSYKLLQDYVGGCLRSSYTLVTLVLLSILSDFENIIESSQHIEELSSSQDMHPRKVELLAQLVEQLRVLNDDPEKEKYCIYIDQKNDWYYRSQTYRQKGSHFIVPAYSGIAMIGGIHPNHHWVKLINGYSIGNYVNSPKVRNLKEAKRIAKQAGYRCLIEFKSINSNLKLVRHEF